MLQDYCLFLYVISKHQGNDYAKFRWFILSLVFVFLAIDENTQIHEIVADYVRPKLGSDLSGLLYWAWVVPYFIAFYNNSCLLPALCNTAAK